MSTRQSTNPRRGMTLVELLVAMGIIAVLAALFIGAASAATRTAREARTKQLIARLHSLVIERYDTYRTRRVEVNDLPDTNASGLRGSLQNDCGFNYPSNLRGFGLDPRIDAYTRLAATRELMKLEAPDRWSDVLLIDVPVTPVRVIAPIPPRYLRESPALRSVYLRKYNEMVANGANQAAILENQSAECLYLFVVNATGDGEARGLFNEQDTGDTDGDGALEFLDGWGRPIEFLRWAPGYESDLQLSFRGLDLIHRRAEVRTTGGLTGEQATRAAIEDDRDPFDLFRLDGPEGVALMNGPRSGSALTRGWRLTPLIYSGGQDEETGIRNNQTDTEGGRSYLARLNPYELDIDRDNDKTPALGEVTDADVAADDITNHQISSLSRAS